MSFTSVSEQSSATEQGPTKKRARKGSATMVAQTPAGRQHFHVKVAKETSCRVCSTATWAALLIMAEGHFWEFPLFIARVWLQFGFN